MATAAAAALLFAAAAADAAPPQRSSEGPWAKGRLLVMPKAGLPEAELGKIVGPHGGKASKLAQNGLYLIELPGNASERAIAARLAPNPHLKFVELDQLVEGTGAANDPYFGSAWHLGRIGAPAVWDHTQGAGVTIAILDTGIDANHPDLAGRLVPGWNFVDNNSNTSDVHGHGTGVAGAAAATTNNGTGVASVAGQARIMPVRIADAKAYAYWSTIAQGITWAADKGAKVINISYDQLPLSSAVISAAQYAKNKGALVVVAAGNRQKDEQFTPTTSMIPVSATDSTDTITTWSSWGDYVAMSAPGLNIWSTNRGGGYGAWWGTSVASPVTAGVVALMMSANPALKNTEVESLLFATTTDLGAKGRDPYYGHGRVNADAAVRAALGMTTTTTVAPSDTQAPTVAISSPVASSTVSGVTAVGLTASDNVGVTKAELRVNGALVATDSTAPFGFSWDTTRVANGMASLEVRAYDAAGNVGTSPVVSVNVANVAPADTSPPTLSISRPTDGATVSGSFWVTASAKDNAGTAGLQMSLSINGTVVSSSTGTGSIKYSWNTRHWPSGTYTLRFDARDAAGNATTRSITVYR